MSDPYKNIWDVFFNVLTIFGAGTAFFVGLHQWQRAQQWQRAAKLDELIEKFEKWPMLRAGACILDWSNRTLKLEQQTIEINNDEVLLALRIHTSIQLLPGESMFPGQQTYYRDVYDATLDFFLRLEIALSAGLIDPGPTQAYFAYWIERLLKFDRHVDQNQVLGGQSPAAAMASYIETYGDQDSLRKLCRHFNLEPPA